MTDAKSQPSRTVCFGELMLRLPAPQRQLLLQTPGFETAFGGAEANVAVSLAHLGSDAAFVTVLPENGLGRAALAEIRKHGVDTSGIRLLPGRLGLYFV